MNTLTAENTLRDAACDPLIRPYFSHFIHHMDLSIEKSYAMTFRAYHDAGGWNDVAALRGLNAVRGQKFYQLDTDGDASGTGKIFVPCAESDAVLDKDAIGFWFFRSEDPKADTRPYVILCPGGAFLFCWNLTEGWPSAVRFNELGYHCIVLNYHTGGEAPMRRALADLAATVFYVRDHADEFPVAKWDDYAVGGFSAGATLVAFWGCDHVGYAAYGAPKPALLCLLYGMYDWNLTNGRGNRNSFPRISLAMTADQAIADDWVIANHCAHYPDAFFAFAEDDTVVSPQNAYFLADLLTKQNTPVYLCSSPTGGHGFGEGRDAHLDWVGAACEHLA